MPILRLLRTLKRTLVAIERTGRPPLPGPLTTLPNGQVSARIYPTDLYERVMTFGTTADVWMLPGISAEQVLGSQASSYQVAEPSGQVCLVLGAGNVSAVPVNDSLSKLFVQNQVVLLKINPVNDYLGPLIESALAPLISEGYLRVAYGGVSEGAYLCSHPDIDCIHLTGSDKTYEAIVFGPGPEGERRKRERRPLNPKPLTAELGNIGPAIIVPGPWSTGDLKYQADNLASHLCDSASFSCSRTRVIVQHAGWSLRLKLLDELQAVLSRIPPRVAYYPDATQLYGRFVSAHPDAQKSEPGREGTLPWTLISGIDSRSRDEICFTTESFCPVMAETALEAAGAADFIRRAVDFANDRLWGTLSASIIVHPASLREPGVSEAVEWAIEHLRYGSVTVNAIPGMAWGLTVAPWGSFPGNDPWNIQSGTGFVHNPYMFSCPQKTVIRGPFRAQPRPLWFPPEAAGMAETLRRVSEYEARPSLLNMARVIVSAMR
jgi:acyl-CoA reductase-like NAD-dependent aldehyde dehydrogenase